MDPLARKPASDAARNLAAIYDGFDPLDRKAVDQFVRTLMERS